MAARFRSRSLMLIMGQRADRLHREKLTEEESEEMRTQLRSLARCRASLHRRFAPHLKHQKRWAEGLQHEAHEMGLKVKIATSGLYRQKDVRDEAELQQKIADNDRHKENIRQAKENIRTLLKDIRELDEKIMYTNRRVAERKEECRTCRVPVPKVASKRLEWAFQTFGDQLAENRRLMAEIHHLGLEKTVAHKLHKDLETELRKLSKRLDDEVYMASDLYVKRSTVHRTVAKLRELYAGRTASFISDIDNFGLKIDVLYNIEDFMLTKNKHREDALEFDRYMQRKMPTPNERDKGMYDDILTAVRERYGDDARVPEIAEMFVELVQENYMLFINLSEMRLKIHDAEVKVHETREKIIENLGKNARIVNEAREFRQEIREKRNQSETIADTIHVRSEQLQEVINNYVRSVYETLIKMGYTEEDIERRAGVLKCVQERNITDFLAEMESFVGKLWAARDYAGFKLHIDKRKKSIGTGEPVAHMPPRVPLRKLSTIVAPTGGEAEYDSSLPVDADERPLTLTEISDLVDKSLAQPGFRPGNIQSVAMMTESLQDTSAEDAEDMENSHSSLAYTDVF